MNSTNKLAIIMRGLPGSGKSYWVEQYLHSLGLEQATHIKQYGYFSTDSLFYQAGEYQFDVKKLSQNHQLNLNGFIQALANNESIVICDNTNVCHWEYIAYQSAAKALGYSVKVVLIGEPNNTAHQQLCAKRNKHRVSFSHIKRMGQQFETD
ncbi:AAA family ATPase [Shewanella intestini]|uniref:ATP-binding protein n=1 Tax=Shewanella intestini TaxID=2017544 RepID=A0ABS5HZE9_9GAMM|nr:MULTISPECIES: ATP-binding protein [Shewanella]MBR9727041.1 ATP-binding protein [Shewanella intestini]MRG35842.1 AAA family ATPase [Shewanella sp. XMDDZSB0408]